MDIMDILIRVHFEREFVSLVALVDPRPHSADSILMAVIRAIFFALQTPNALDVYSHMADTLQDNSSCQKRC